uniref:Uncharacterized protein LOC100185627 n=1 Tax=Phallusia mammillata TaxID=59560 RepID=A0A6F9DHL4_9ASCI|nr:uncharacterized protein LOC100185627 [Phallusia mammillata]
MGSTMSIEAKTLGYPPTEVTPRTARVGDNGSIVTSRSLPVEGATSSRFLPSALRERLKTRSAKSRGGITSVSLDGAPVTSFPTRDSWKLRTDTVRRKGAAISIHVTIDDVTLPPQPSMTWGSSLHVTGQQIRERVARVFFSHVVNDSRVLCKTIDRIEKIRGLVVEHALKRIGGGGNGIEITNSQLVFQCRCLHPETVEQVWLLYQSGQLRENIQAGLVTKRARHACAVDFLHLRAHITEEEYRRALGLLRRKPMPNTKSGRFYVTTGTGGAIGGTGGMVQAQNRALMSVTRYLKLPTPAENNVQAPPPNPPATSLAANETPTVAKSSPLKNKPRPSGNLLHKVLGKELEVLRQRLRMCEDEWCEFAANQMAAMLRCASNVMRRRIVGATTRTQLTPRCTNVSLLRSLYKAIKATQTPKNPSPRAPPTIPSNPQQVTHIGIALYPSDVTFSNTDLVTSVDDDDDVIKARKQEERDFVHSYCHFTELIAELGACRATLQERIVARLTTNPTVAPSKHLYLAKDVYNLMERWRHMLARDFNFGQDEVVQRFSKRILSDETVIATFASDLLDQFPGIVALLPTMFHISEQILTKVKDLIPKSEAPSSNRIYTSVTKSQGGSTHNAKHLSIWLSA